MLTSGCGYFSCHLVIKCGLVWNYKHRIVLFLYLYLSKFILIWTSIVPLSISKYLYLSLNRVGNDKSILSILLGYPFIESNCATCVNMSAYVLMCQWKYIFFVVPMNSLLSERLWSSRCLIYWLELIHMIRSLASDKGTNWW